MKKIALLLAVIMMMVTVCASAETFTGTAEGYNGAITAEVTVEDGKIVGLTLTGAGETPTIGGKALEKLQTAILNAGTFEVDGVSGATWTSNGVFNAILNALGLDEAEEDDGEVIAMTADTLLHGIGFASTPRLGPGKDANGVPVYSFNEVIAYVVVDGTGCIMDLEVDIVEIITPNHDESNEGDNFLAGWPGLSYNSDADGDGVVDGELEETPEIFTEEIGQWLTKRQKHGDYKMNSGTWESEMDAFENFFIGNTIDDIRAWESFATSDRNGRPINASSTNEADAAKYNSLNDNQKFICDMLTGATMSVNDAHGEILNAIEAAIANAVPMTDVKSVNGVGLGVVVTPRLGPGSDDQGVPCYSFNVVAAGLALDADARIAGVRCDIMEIITPNHDGADDNAFTGWPGQSYNADNDGDGKVEGVLTQTEESFVEQIAGYRTKRMLGNAYKMNSGTWTQEMDAYEGAMLGMNAEELKVWLDACFSDSNGRALHATATKEADVTKYNAMTDEQKEMMDAIACATMSLTDAHGNLAAAILQAFDVVKAADITVQ